MPKIFLCENTKRNHRTISKNSPKLNEVDLKTKRNKEIKKVVEKNITQPMYYTNTLIYIIELLMRKKSYEKSSML